MYAIITAMEKEYSEIAQLLTDTHLVQSGLFSFLEGTLEGCRTRRIVLARSGIGKVNAALGAAALIERYQPEAIINTGVAGGIDRAVGVMDLVVGSTVVYHDVDCGPENETGQVQGLPAEYVADEALLQRFASLAETVGATMHVGQICTGDQFITEAEQLFAIKEQFPTALAVDMESAAIAQTCFLYDTPFLSVRTISDTPGVDNHFEQYSDFWGTLAQHSFEATRALLEAL